MLAVGGYDEFTLSARFDVVFFLHESSNPFFPNSHTICPKFSPNPWPAIFAFAGCMHSPDVNQQSNVVDALAGNLQFAFLKMARSIFTFVSSVLSRVNSICSALTGLAPAPANWPFTACRTQFSNV